MEVTDEQKLKVARTVEAALKGHLGDVTGFILLIGLGDDTHMVSSEMRPEAMVDVFRQIADQIEGGEPVRPVAASLN